MLDQKQCIIGDIVSVVRHVPREVHWKIPKSPFSRIAYQIDGEFLHKNNFNSFTASRDMLIFINKNEELYVDCLKYGSSIAVHVNFLDDLQLNSGIVQLDSSNMLKKLFFKIEKEWLYKKDAYILEVMSMLYQILPVMFAKHLSRPVPESYSKLLEEAVSMIKTNYPDKMLTVEKLSRRCGISEQYLRALFRKSKMPSPRKYMTSIRISAAAELLKTASYSVTEIADMTGFSDICYFCRVFKETTGMTPVEYMML